MAMWGAGWKYVFDALEPLTDDDLTNTGHTASVLSASATGNTAGILLGSSELMSFFNVDSVVKNSGSSAGTINTTFSAPDLAFDYLAAGEHLDITYVVQLDDHAGGVLDKAFTIATVPKVRIGSTFSHCTGAPWLALIAA